MMLKHMEKKLGAESEDENIIFIQKNDLNIIFNLFFE